MKRQTSDPEHASLDLRGFYQWLRSPAGQRRHSAVSRWVENESRARWPGRRGRPKVWGDLLYYARVERLPRLSGDELIELAAAWREYQIACGNSPKDTLDELGWS